ncbi:MAG: WYL domain-containing protein [Anaerolineae bacterium]|nr:WYL domain-containing protein [Anaerolineae bacterium]
MTDTDPWLYTLHFLHDAARILSLARQRPLTRNPQGHLQPEALIRLITCCRLAPPSQANGETGAPHLSFLVHLLERAGWLAPANASAPLACSAAALAALQQPLPVCLDHLREAWWYALLPDMDTLPPLRLPPTHRRRWRNLTLAICAAVAALSDGCAVPLSQLARDLESRGQFTPPGAEAHLPAARAAYRRQALALFQFTTAVALRALGFVVYEESPHPAIRPLPAGAAWLRAALAQQSLRDAPSAAAGVELALPGLGNGPPAPALPPLTFIHDLHFTLSPYAPPWLTFAAQHFAIPEVPAPPAGDPAPDCYALTRAGLEHGAIWGYPAADVLFLLGRHSGGEISPEAWAQLQTWRQEIQEVQCESGYRLHFSVAALQQLRQRKAFRRRVTPGYGKDAVWVPRSESIVLFRYLRRLGYTLPVVAAAPPLSSSNVLPLARLLTALHAYQALRARLPGLADLSMDTLIRDLERALPQPDRAAVAHLVAAQRNLLECAWPTPKDNESAESPFDANSLDPQIQNLQSKIQTSPCLLLTYVDAQARRTQRRVWPVRIEQSSGLTYLVARCELRGEERRFRLDRIVAAEEVTG